MLYAHLKKAAVLNADEMCKVDNMQ